VQQGEILHRESGSMDGPVQPARLPAFVAGTWQYGEKPSVWRSMAAALAAELAARRLFVLLPFAMIAGLIGYAVVPVEPQAWALAAGGVAILVLAVGLR